MKNKAEEMHDPAVTSRIQSKALKLANMLSKECHEFQRPSPPKSRIRYLTGRSNAINSNLRKTQTSIGHPVSPTGLRQKIVFSYKFEQIQPWTILKLETKVLRNTHFFITSTLFSMKTEHSYKTDLK